MGRRVRALGAALLVSAVLVAGTGCSGSKAAPAALPSSVEVRGRSVPLLDAQAWTDASIPARSSRTLTVFATGSDREGGGACGPPVVRLSAKETSSTVRVLVSDYQDPPDSVQSCPAIGYVPTPQRVRLTASLGERRLLDAKTGKAPRLLIGTDWPTVPHPPDRPSSAVLQPQPGEASPGRLWTYPDGRSMRLQFFPSARADAPYGRIVRRFELAGGPATVYATGGKAYGVTEVLWTPNPKQSLQLQLTNSPHRQWSVDAAVAVARSVTGYRITASDRLPQPSTPGTAAAAYSSADGPVRHESNLFKSSGVSIGVNCRGAGRLTVTVRGEAYRFDCGAALSHFVRESVGRPFDVFSTDITADPDVRWAVILARASLDGS